MRVSIVVPDGVVILDGQAIRGVDLSDMRAAGVHAIQWDGAKGHIEGIGLNNKKRCVPINSSASFQSVIQRAQALRKARSEAARAEQEAALHSGEHRKALRRRAVLDNLVELALAVTSDNPAAKARLAQALSDADARADAEGAA